MAPTFEKRFGKFGNTMKYLHLILLCTCLSASFLKAAPAAGRIIRVRPGDGSFTRAARTWKPGDTILLAPGEYRERFAARAGEKTVLRDLTIKAEIPGSVVFRGDVPAPRFTPCGNGI